MHEKSDTFPLRANAAINTIIAPILLPTSLLIFFNDLNVVRALKAGSAISAPPAIAT
jgi:hypothetical protein